MLRSKTVRNWYKIHKWTSLVCTAFLLLVCLTGLPLIFMSEINGIGPALPSREAAPVIPGDTRSVSIDQMIGVTRTRFPGQDIVRVSLDDDEPIAFVGLVPSFVAAKDKPEIYHWLKFDTRTGEVINTSEQFKADIKAHPSLVRTVIDTFMGVMLTLHVNMYARLPGQLFLAFMALLFVVALVSGAVVYGPFMRRLDFGTVRKNKSSRLKWFDLHNLLGIVILLWASVVGVTGAINEIAVLLQRGFSNDVRAVWASMREQPRPRQNEMSSVQAAFDTARRALPGKTVFVLSYPSPLPDSDRPYHYWLVARGSTPFTERLGAAVMIDVRTGELTKVFNMPWYLRVLELSRPLHFGDYGGLPLKILWALFDLALITALGSGLYLWLSRRKSPAEKELDRLVEVEERHLELDNGMVVTR